MPVGSLLNRDRGIPGLSSAPTRPSGGIGLAQPVASTQSIITPTRAPQPPQQQPLQQRTVAPPSLPKSAPAQPAPQAAPEGEMNAFSKIGLLLSNVAAGMEGRPLPSDQLEQNRLKREELRMRQTAQNMEIAGTIATIASKTPGGQVSKVVEGLFATLPDQSQTAAIQPLVEALTAKPQIDEDTYPIVAPYLAQLYDVGGLDAVQKTLDSGDRMQALRDRAIADNRESADMKVQQVIGLVQRGAQSGLIPPDVAQALSGTMTTNKIRELNPNLPANMRFSPVQIAALDEFGFNGDGVTILSKKIADKVAEADALRPGELSEFEQKERLKQRFNPSGEGSSGFGNSLQGRAYNKFLFYQNMRQQGQPLTPQQEADESAARRILETPQTRIDPATGQLTTTNPEPLGGQPASSPVTPAAVSAAPIAEAPAPNTGGLFDKTDLATGLISGLRQGVAQSIGQEIPAVAHPETLQTRQEFITSSNAAIRALTLNPKMPVTEMENVRKQFGMEPSIFDSPVNLRNRMISIDSSIDKKVIEEQRIIDDPAKHVDRKREASEKIDALLEYKSILGVPPEIKDEAEYNALPPGSRYRDGGKVYTKGAK